MPQSPVAPRRPLRVVYWSGKNFLVCRGGERGREAGGERKTGTPTAEWVVVKNVFLFCELLSFSSGRKM